MLSLLAEISGQELVQDLVWLVVIGLIFWLLWWFISFVGIPEPFNKVARVIVALAAMLLLINFLLGFAGHPIIHWR